MAFQEFADLATISPALASELIHSEALKVVRIEE